MSRCFGDEPYDDEPWNRPEPCATTGCEETCDIPATSAFCYHCRTRELRARANATHRMADWRE